MTRVLGYYWIKYPVNQWQIAYWNGFTWLILGTDYSPEESRIKEVGKLIKPHGK